MSSHTPCTPAAVMEHLLHPTVHWLIIPVCHIRHRHPCSCERHLLVHDLAHPLFGQHGRDRVPSIDVVTFRLTGSVAHSTTVVQGELVKLGMIAANLDGQDVGWVAATTRRLRATARFGWERELGEKRQ
jgi:hypothetical protein